jgi:DNA-binding NarL/FixJ family response regulator
MSFVSLYDRVVLIEDDFVIRESYRMIIDNSNKFRVVGDFPSYEDASSFIKKIQPKIILMDIGLPGISGIEATRKIKIGNPFIDVIIVSIFEDDEFVFRALKNGASGYISKTSNHIELINALEEVQQGGAPMSSKIARLLIEDLHTNPTISTLTMMEVSILLALSEGKTNTQVAESLDISRAMVRTHIRTIYNKLNVESKSEAIAAGKKQRII